MRLSANQKDVLFVLLAVEQKGNSNPVQSTVLLKLINSSRSSDIFASNLRESCHTLNGNGLINKYRSSSLKLAWKLTDKGREIASKVYKSKLKESA
ncbi:chromosome segregation protein ParM [Pseudoalteromonas luteoviolacea]|nr:chromosome segregation protein ParM [Pseudoalteromonas luteoviolacea]